MTNLGNYVTDLPYKALDLGCSYNFLHVKINIELLNCHDVVILGKNAKEINALVFYV